MTAYAGIGSRQTPDDVLALMSRLATYLSTQGYTLRSGGADGADTAFETGCTGPKEIYLPWPGFNSNPSALTSPSIAAFELAAKFHPAWGRLPPAARKLQARNGHQVLGANLDDPVAFIVCWTPDANPIGGTGQALRIAAVYGIRVLNLADPVARALIEARLDNHNTADSTALPQDHSDRGTAVDDLVDRVLHAIDQARLPFH